MGKKKRVVCLVLSAVLMTGMLFGRTQAASGRVVGGKVTTSGSGTHTVSLSLLSGGKVAYSKTVTGNSAGYDFGEVASGSYTLRAEKALHVTREYPIAVGASAVSQDVSLLLLGDTNGDGRVNVADTARIYSHIRRSALLTDSYLLACADISGDGRHTVVDVARAYTRLRNPVSPQLYTVTFRDRNGKVLKTQLVEAGKSATPPVEPAGFTGWDRAFDQVASDLTVTALDHQEQAPSFQVGHVTGAAGQTVQVPILIKNNPGVAGARITVSYDKKLTLTDAQSADAFSALHYTGPGKYVSPCNFTWDSEKGMAAANGTVLTLSFQLPASAPSGQVYRITCSYEEGDIYNEALNNVRFEMLDGTITVR